MTRLRILFLLLATSAAHAGDSSWHFSSDLFAPANTDNGKMVYGLYNAPGSPAIMGSAGGSSAIYQGFYSAGATNGSQDRGGTIQIFQLNDVHVNAGKGGFFQNQFQTTAEGTWDPSAGAVISGVLGLQFSGISSRGGFVFGGNAYAWSDTVSSQAVVGFESDTDNRAGTIDKIGIQAADKATSVGSVSGINAAYLVGAEPSAYKWEYGFYIAAGRGAFPLRTTATAFHLGAGTVSTGIDLNSATITGNAWQSPNALITGAGEAAFKRVVASATNTEGYWLGGSQILFANVNYVALNDPSGATAFFVGNTSDPTNYHRNTTHKFQTRAGAAELLWIDSTGADVKSGVFKVGGTSGLSSTKTVRASGGASDCTLTFTGGILTGGTC